MTEEKKSMKKTAFELSCPGCGAMHRVDMRMNDPAFPIKASGDKTYNYFDGSALCGCGRPLFAAPDGEEEEEKGRVEC
jgi:hypothetical protein